MSEAEHRSTTDWANWQPGMRATLLFVLRGDEVLLIHKKRGLGAGKVNAPGGKIEPGETAEQAAVREVEEEVGLRVRKPEAMGELRFQFVDGLALYCAVFRSTEFDGEIGATDEADPFWCKLNAIPYDNMWADDALWLPGMLQGKTFDGRFDFDDERMLWHQLKWGGA